MLKLSFNCTYNKREKILIIHNNKKFTYHIINLSKLIHFVVPFSYI